MTAEAEESNPWSQHLSTLAHLVFLRRQVSDTENFPSIVWCICTLDLEALLSGAGTGQFAIAVLNNDIILPPQVQSDPRGRDRYVVTHADNPEALPTILQVEHDITILCIRLGLLACKFRNDTTFGRTTGDHRIYTIRTRQSQISELQAAMRSTWLSRTKESTYPAGMPTALKLSIARACILCRAFMIYSHTFMWPGQKLETPAVHDNEIEVCATQILYCIQGLVEAQFLHWPIVFPIFLAGFATKKDHEKTHALHLIRAIEEKSISQSIKVIRKALAAVHAEQAERFMDSGQFLDVD